MISHLNILGLSLLIAETFLISIYKLGDVGISSNLIGSLSLTNGHCPPPGRWIMKQWPAGRVNSCFAERTENDIFRKKGITIPNDTKKATKLGMIVFRDKQCFNTQFAYMSSVFCPDRQASLMPLSLNNNCPFMAPFQSPIEVNSTSIKQNVSIQENLNAELSLFKMIVISNTPTASTWYDFRRKLYKLFFQFR